MSRARLLAAAFGADGTLNTSDVAGLSTVAVSGQYTDLLGKPVLSTVAASGLFVDLLSKPTTLAGYGISDALASATASSTYQTILVSGTSIKTVNGNSVLGSGNIQIDGGVTSFNTRTGAVTLSSGDVTTALGYTPPQPTGTGASGTWGISISGNAATATTATNVSGGTASVTTLAYNSTLTGGTGIINIGSGQFYKDASGNLGIGTSSPSQKLQVAGGKILVDNNQSLASLDSSGTSRDILKLNASNQLEVAAAGAVISDVIFKTLGSERMRLDSSGNLGIGTNNPLRKLDISGGGFAFTESGGAARNIHWGDTTNIYPVTIAGNATTGNCFLTFNTNTFGNAAVERFRVGPAGEWGIGGANYGTSGQVLTSGGPNAAPSWQNAGGGTPTLNVTSSTSVSAAASNHYVLTGGATTVTLPASPAAGAVVWVTVANGRVDNVIARNGQNINSLAENMTIDQANAGIQLRYADATRGWIFT